MQPKIKHTNKKIKCDFCKKEYEPAFMIQEIWTNPVEIKLNWCSNCFSIKEHIQEVVDKKIKEAE